MPRILLKDFNMTAECDLSKYCVVQAPATLYYIPDFISVEEEQALLQQVNSVPKTRWTQLANRRLQNWGGLPHPKGTVAEDLPKWLRQYTDKISNLGVFDGKVANHVLVNEYLPGQGIMPHVDGPLYYPTVSTISLGSHTLLDFYTPITDQSQTQGNTEQSITSFEERHICSMYLERRSLILVKDDMYKINLHGIVDRTSDTITDKIVNVGACPGVNIGDNVTRGTRVSLTIRHVPNTIKAKLLFGKKK